MDWCEDNGLDYVFGLSGNKILAAAVDDKADDIRTRRALEQMLVLRGYAQTATPPDHGGPSAASALASRRRNWGSISATSSPTSPMARPNISTTRSIARADRWISTRHGDSRRFCGGGGVAACGLRRHAAPGGRRCAYRLQRRDRSGSARTSTARFEPPPTLRLDRRPFWTQV